MQFLKTYEEQYGPILNANETMVSSDDNFTNYQQCSVLPPFLVDLLVDLLTLPLDLLSADHPTYYC